MDNTDPQLQRRDQWCSDWEINFYCEEVYLPDRPKSERNRKMKEILAINRRGLIFTNENGDPTAMAES